MGIIRKTVSLSVALALCLNSLSLAIPLASAKGVDPEEKVYYYLSDHLGGVDAVLDEEGNVVERRDYLPYGSERLADDSTTSPAPEDYGFTGKELDEETGLYYYGARYYDPVIGRFISLDPLVLGESEKPLNSVLANPQALNGYSYVLNNPLRYVDEEGEYGKDVHYDLTYVLGLIAGLKSDTAKSIAYHNQNTDDNPATSPGGYGSVKQFTTMAKNFILGVTHKYHFTRRGETYNQLYEAKAEKSASKFGQALHTFQDTWSHGKFFSNYKLLHKLAPLGHAIEGHDPDKTNLRSELANDMGRATFYQLRSFKLATEGPGELSLKEFNNETCELWNKAFDLVDDYNSSANKLNSNIHAISSSAEETLKKDN